MNRKILKWFFLCAIGFSLLFLYIRLQMYFSQGKLEENIIFEIKKGEGIWQISKNLSEKRIISHEIFFLLYTVLGNGENSIYPGEYLLSGKMRIPEIVVIITNSKKTYEKVLLKEGWTAKEMAKELAMHGFSEKEFLAIINNPSAEMLSKFKVLQDKPQGRSLEGYLFPDTYYFSGDATANGIVEKILSNTENKISAELRNDIKKQQKTIFEVINLASIVEREMVSSSEAKLIAGIFQNRLTENMLLQSDAPLTYILEDKEDQHQARDLEIDSPYNTYKYKGLPLGPIANPGLAAILGAIYPEKSEYYFFLTANQNGVKKTVFSRTFEEHVENRRKYGL